MSLTVKSKSDIKQPIRFEKAFCEFFAGIGLVREGLKRLGWHCVYANDNDPKKQELYQAKFTDCHFHLEDVRDTDKVLGKLGNPPVLATASFPCIDLSLAGWGRGLSGDHSSTFFGFTAALAAMKRRCPKILLIENVNGLLTSHGGKDFQAVATTLASLGYYLDSFVLDAKHFVPQSRQRVFVIGVHRSVVNKAPVVLSNGSAFDPWREALEQTASIRPKRLIQLLESTELNTGWIASPISAPSANVTNLKEFIDLDENQEWWDKPQVLKHYESMSDSHKAQVDLLMLDKKAVHVGTIYRRKRNGTTRAEVRFDGIAGCLRVPRGGSARQIVIVIDRGKLRIRWMSPREYARLQGVPDFPLVGRPNQQMAGFGDAVCVPVIEWIDKYVLSPVYDAIA
ncbi:DNA cytosine methyltransferase [Aeoliella mucimassa]|uniref:DNA (cytosine-5-)-methyltransferase n=1 Tax=Aeoliella mucimassa TaxID=2527972 RepID=A0A518AGM7_9BACT|nr:DNA (cytosine-5-)-methyltransferase [Aeoliella mucimassa]QDU53880.1 Modification methylase HpaII [Aeoliella mucimassa]